MAKPINLKLLIVSHSSRRAGAERVVRLLAEGLPQAGVQLVVTTPEEGPLTCALSTRGVHTETAPVRWWTNPTSRTIAHFANRLRERVEHLVEVVATNDVDAVLSNSMVTVEGALAAARAGVPHAWYVHEMLGSGEHLRPLFPVVQLHRYMNALSDRLFVASTAVGDDLQSTGEIHSGKIDVVNYGLDLSGDEGVNAATASDGPAAPVVLFPARLTERKGVFTMLEAFARVRAQIPTARLVLAGEGPRPMRRRVARLISQRRLSGVDAPGFVANMHLQMARADVVALPSAADPFPVAVLEAMAHAKPVVGTYSGGMADQIADGETGYLVSVGDPEALAARIIELLGDAETRHRMGNSARERLRARFPTSGMFNHLANSIRDMTLDHDATDSARNASAEELLQISQRRPVIDLEERASQAGQALLAAARRAADLRRGRAA